MFLGVPQVSIALPQVVGVLCSFGVLGYPKVFPSTLAFLMFCFVPRSVFFGFPKVVLGYPYVLFDFP